MNEQNTMGSMGTAAGYVGTARPLRTTVRVVELPWEEAERRFAVEYDYGYGGWAALRHFATPDRAKEFAGLYVKGPRVLMQVSGEANPVSGD